MSTSVNKGAALLAFLKQPPRSGGSGSARYRAAEQVLWFADIPRDRGEYRSRF